MKLSFSSDFDRSLLANILFFLFTYNFSAFLSYTWLGRHLVHDFPNSFLFFSGFLGLLIIIILVNWKVWIPFKVFVSIIISTFFSFVTLSIFIKGFPKSSHDMSAWLYIKSFLSFPLIITIAFRLYISIPVVVTIYLIFRIFLHFSVKKGE